MVMPKLKPSTQTARREHILDAAERCFACTGFHRTSMQDICREAEVSAGALYVYFVSKEALIAGIVERDRAKLASQLEALNAAPDLLTAIAAIGRHYAVEIPDYKRKLCLEIGAESTRNETVSRLYTAVDSFVIESLTSLFARARAGGKIAPGLDDRSLGLVMAILGDGLLWRRAIDPAFDAEAAIATLAGVISSLLNPVPPPANAAAPNPTAAMPPSLDTVHS
jgi:AcrR family transcriptional regulator